jgi:hypothetical protein
MADMYLVDWQETAYGQRPEPRAVMAWLKANGFTVEGMPKVYANGTVSIMCQPNPVELWHTFEPVAETVEDKLSAHIASLLEARAELLAIPEHKRSPADRALLATMALLMFGVGDA